MAFATRYFYREKQDDSNPSEQSEDQALRQQTRSTSTHFTAKQGSESRPLRQQKRNFCLPKVPFLFIQAAGLVYHRRAKCGAYHQGRQAALVSHQPLWGWILLRLDDIQNFAWMIYRNKLRMIYKAYALIYLRKCDIINSSIDKNLKVYVNYK